MHSRERRGHAAVATLASAVVAAIVAATLAACSGASGGEGATIAEALGEPAFGEVDWNDKQYQVQELISECMRAEGWEYVPVRVPDASAAWEAEDQRAMYAERGFGLAWSVLHPQDDAAEEATPDPNQAYAATLTEAEQAAYWASYAGTEAEQAEWAGRSVDAETGETVIEVGGDFGFGPGCNGEAHQAVYGGEPTQAQVRRQAVAALYEDLAVRIAADPRVVTLNATWSACMADAGFALEDPEELWARAFPGLQERYTELTGGRLLEPEEVTGGVRAGLEALLADEIALTVAFYDCSEGYDGEMARISAEIEAAFVREHREEIEQVAAALAGE